MMKDNPQRKQLCIIDGIIGQQGDAPISGTPIGCGIIFGGYNSVIIDVFATKVMGIDYKQIKTLSEVVRIHKWRLVGKDTDFSFNGVDIPNLDFVLPKGWQ